MLVGDDRTEGETERVGGSDIVVNALYHDVADGLASFDSYGIVEDAVVKAFNGIALTLVDLYSESTVVVGRLCCRNRY